MKIMYLTWGETPRSYGVFGSQVIGQYAATSCLCPNDEFCFLSAVPVINSSLVRDRFSYRSELRKIRSMLGNVRFDRIPIFAPQLFVNSNIITFKFMHLLAHKYLKRKLERFSPDVVHCRSYHAAWAAVMVKKKTALSYKVVFDARGLWPEEIALKKKYSVESRDYLFLKDLEQWILKESDATISVSDTMKNYFISLGCKYSERVYLSASVDKLTSRRISKKLNRNNTLTLCYVGALSEKTWHKPKQLLDLYMAISRLFGKIKLIIVTTSNHQDIRKIFKDVSDSNLLITSTKTVEELADIMNNSDIGVLSYFIPKSDQEKKLSKMVLAVKTAEYLAAGLPVLVNRYCGGAASVIKNNGLGIVYNPETFEELSEAKINKLLNSKIKEKAINFAKQNFDYHQNALKYRDIYLSLTAYKPN